MDHLVVQNFTGAGSIGILLINTITWTEEGDWRALVNNCTNAVIIEAGAHGVGTAFLVSVGDYIIVSADSFPLSGGSSKTLDRAAMLSFARAAVGARYGFLTIACIVINIFTPRIISFRRPGTLICSGLGMRALEHGGAVSPVDPFQITPGEVAQLAATQQTTRPVS